MEKSIENNCNNGKKAREKELKRIKKGFNKYIKNLKSDNCKCNYNCYPVVVCSECQSKLSRKVSKNLSKNGYIGGCKDQCEECRECFKYLLIKNFEELNKIIYNDEDYKLEYERFIKDIDKYVKYTRNIYQKLNK